MLTPERIIAVITNLRLTWAQEAVQQPNMEHAAFAYGQAAGRDQAADLILEQLNSMLEEEQEDEDGT